MSVQSVVERSPTSPSFTGSSCPSSDDVCQPYQYMKVVINTTEGAHPAILVVIFVEMLAIVPLYFQ